ncbi:cytochrome c [Sinorhizobium terangae]|uniref:cytochrome c n=1 Tax=Sinorhizobium terangae TaxID=110322 RepID=UPI0024B252EE|nr:cytochrome c [Sinorhizobium terangae]WFU50355.1 cytochrome c [Sinorhizobium terangae]
MRISRKFLLMAGTLVALPFAARANGPEFQLTPGANLDVVEENCAACHSLDYVAMNSPFLDEKGWRTEVTKMVNAFGAPIDAGDQEKIVEYLSTNYGRK